MASQPSTSLSPTATKELEAILASASALATQQAALASASAAISGTVTTPPYYKIIGIVLALVSGLFIGSSFVFKKKGLLTSQKKVLNQGGEAGEGHAYLKSPMWWSGMSLMIVGEVCNFVAYAFADAILVTPMGALSVVISAVLSSIFLKERLSFFGKVGCLLCVLGATIIALNAPKDQAVSTIPEFEKLFLAPGFLVFASIIVISALLLIFVAAPKWGKSNMLVYISICSIIGGLSVVATQGLGASIVTTFSGNSQFKYWFMYFLIGFVVCTLLTEINYLNKALELFNTAMVTPTYYVMFTFATLVTSIILFQGLKAPVTDIVTLVLGFLVICCGITLLQMSKVDPMEFTALDPQSTVFLAADKEIDTEPGLAAEEPGVDGLRGFGGILGSIHRNSLIARHSTASSLAAASERSSARRRRQESFIRTLSQRNPDIGMVGLKRHNLWDRPISDELNEDPSKADSSRGTVTSDHHDPLSRQSSNAGGSQTRNDGHHSQPSTNLSSTIASIQMERPVGFKSTSARPNNQFEKRDSDSSAGYQDPHDWESERKSRRIQASLRNTETSEGVNPNLGNLKRSSFLRDNQTEILTESPNKISMSMIPSSSPPVRARNLLGEYQSPRTSSKTTTLNQASTGETPVTMNRKMNESVHEKERMNQHKTTRERVGLGVSGSSGGIGGITTKNNKNRFDYDDNDDDKSELESLVRANNNVLNHRSSSSISSTSSSSNVSSTSISQNIIKNSNDIDHSLDQIRIVAHHHQQLNNNPRST